MRILFALYIVILLSNKSNSDNYLTNRLVSLTKTCSIDSLIYNSNHLCNGIPDYFQEDSSFGGFPNGGKMYCAPVSVSNSIMSLLGRFLYRMTSDNPIEYKKNQFLLIKTLASPRYIATGRLGSGPAEICKGVQRFLYSNNVRNFSISHYGWRQVPSRFQKERFPNVTLLPDYLKSKQNAIWLNIGWYTHNDSNSYYRTGGHWVTLTALKRDNIVVHDPSSSSDCCETIPLTTLQKGILKGDIDGLPLPAEGFRCFRNKYGTYGIIDGVIILELKENMLRRAAGSQVKIIAHSR